MSATVWHSIGPPRDRGARSQTILHFAFFILHSIQPPRDRSARTPTNLHFSFCTRFGPPTTSAPEPAQFALFIFHFSFCTRFTPNWAFQRPERQSPTNFHFSFCTRFTPNWVLQWPQRPEPDQDRRRERNHRGRWRTTRNREDSGGPSRRLRRVRSSPCRKRGKSSRRRSCRSQQA
jgi:hypothetical protein